MILKYFGTHKSLPALFIWTIYCGPLPYHILPVYRSCVTHSTRTKIQRQALKRGPLKKTQRYTLERMSMMNDIYQIYGGVTIGERVSTKKNCPRKLLIILYHSILHYILLYMTYKLYNYTFLETILCL